ncbi:MAG: Uma2 family endonuclease [Chloroflexia bacterium]|nr:Uma2 family endonuclease [Chloroflexia bacterium]
MSAPTKLMTFTEFRALPDDGNRYELIDGVLVVPPSPSPLHNRVAGRLYWMIGEYLLPLRRKDFLFFAPLDVRLTEFRAVQPDLLYVNPDRPGGLTSSYVAGVPDLVVEVLSPSNRSHDRVTKFGIYAEAGVQEYWIVDPVSETVTLYVLTEGRYVERPIEDGIARSVVLPGLEVDLEALFANLHQGFSG